MTIDTIRNIIIEEAESHLSFVDEYGFSKIAKEEIVEEGDGVAVARFRIPLQDNTSLQLLINRVCERISDEPRVFMDMREQYTLMYYECVWVIDFKEKKNEENVLDAEEKETDKTNHQESKEYEEEFGESEIRTEDRLGQDFDVSQYDEAMFA